MRKKMVVEVKEGSSLQLAVGGSPTGESIAIPQGVTSMTVIVWDTPSFQQARAKQERAKQARAKRGNRPAGRAKAGGGGAARGGG